MKEKSFLVIFIAFVILIMQPMGNFAELKPESAYVNKQIQKWLDKYPEETGDDLKLTNVFNEKRKKLTDAVIKDGEDTDTPENQAKAEAAIDEFKDFARDYKKVANKLTDATEDLKSIEEDSNIPVETRYEAVTLRSKLEKSASSKDVEKALEAYNDFKKKSKNDSNNTPPNQQRSATTTPLPASPSIPPPLTSPSISTGSNLPSSLPPLTNENKQDLKKIFNILNKLHRKDSPEMDNLIDKILKNPKDLKKLYKALKELSEEDYDDDDIFSDLFSYFF